jgi:hypothetical protein
MPIHTLYMLWVVTSADADVLITIVRRYVSHRSYQGLPPNQLR